MARTTAVETATNTTVVEAAVEADYEVLVSQTSVDRRLLTGPFATNVWGGRYEVTGFAGKGSQGATFIGRDRKTGERVALKLFDLGKAKDWKAADLFDREVATLKKLSHSGVPRFIDVIVDDTSGARVLVMSYVSGDSLSAVLKRDGQLPEKRLWSVAVDAASILSTVHSEGIIHRDLKPENLVLKDDGTLAIVDFGGVGRVRAEAGSTVVGTFGYMAPEQLYGAQTPATDLYALGATLLTLATNKSPEGHPRNGLALDVDAAAPWLSESMRALLKRLLSPDPTGRPKDGADLLRALKEVAAHKPEAKRPDAIVHKDGSVDAIWTDDPVGDAVQITGGVFGVLLSTAAMLATFGLGRVVIPIVLTLISGFLSGDARKNLLATVNIINRRAEEMQRLLMRGATTSASAVEEVGQRNKNKREKRKERRDARFKRSRHQGDAFWRE